MPANLRFHFSKLSGDLTATEKAAWQNSSLEGALARLARYGEEFLVLVLGLDRPERVNDQLGHSSEMAMLSIPDTINSDAVRASASPQTDDLYDVTFHHRYYGSSAYN
jgi:hypothetical protein